MLDLKKNESGNISLVMSLIGVAVGLLALAIVLTIAPVVGHSVETANAVPYMTAGSNTAVANAWSGNNSAILNGSELWIQDSPLLGSAAIVVIAGVIIATLLGAFLVQRN